MYQISTLLLCLFLSNSLNAQQPEVITSIEYTAQVFDGNHKEEPFLIKVETYNSDFLRTFVDVYTKDGLLLSQKMIYNDSLLTEKLAYSGPDRKYDGKTRFYYNDHGKLTRLVRMNRLYYKQNRTEIRYNKSNGKSRVYNYVFTKSKSRLFSLDIFWVEQVIPKRSKFKYKYFNDQFEITQKDKRPKQKTIWTRNSKGQLLGLFRMVDDVRIPNLLISYNPSGQKVAAEYFVLDDHQMVIGITGRLHLKKGDKLKVLTKYLSNGQIDFHEQYLNGQLIGIQTLKYLP